MKRNFLSICLLAMFSLAATFSLQAQEDANQQIIVIQKATSEDGSVTIKKKRFDQGESPERYIEALNLENGIHQKMELTLIMDGEDEENAETIVFYRNGEVEEVRVMGSGNLDEEYFDFENMKVKQCTKPSKALVGIYPESVENGVMVTSLVYGGGARAAGIKAGDVITAIDGEEISNNSALTKVMNNYQPGDVAEVSFLREGEAMLTNVTFTERGKTNEKNPCKVFIGVSLGTSSGPGIRIDGIIDGWPAEEMALQSDDRILALDGVAVEDADELLVQRNRHDSGEFFTLTIMRGEDVFEVDGQFKECPKEENVQEVPTPQPTPEPEPTPQPDLRFTDNMLELENFAAFPNPTVGNLNVRFVGAAEPTLVKITDIYGRTVFQEELEDFSGEYAKEVDLSGGTPGTLMLTVKQGDKVQSKSIVLLNRA